jgi:hypothetical protein
MSSTTSDSASVVNFWQFWLWQYTSRNKEYREEYAVYQNRIKDKSRTVRDEAFSALYDKFKCFPKDPQEDSCSDKILQCAQNKKYDKLVTNFICKKYDSFTTYIHSEDEFDYKVDLKKPIDQVLAEVSYWYQIRSLAKQHPLMNDEAYLKEYSKIQDRLIYQFIKHSPEQFNIDYEMRAVGLWLWDFVKKKDFAEIKRGQVYQGIKTLDQKINLLDKGFGSIEEDSTKRKLERYYKLTDNCINNRKVLPLKSSKKKTA